MESTVLYKLCVHSMVFIMSGIICTFGDLAGGGWVKVADYPKIR